MAAVRTVELFSEARDRLDVKAGDIIFQDGEIGQVMYGIIEGTVELQVDGKPIEVIKADDVFGEGALVQVSHCRASTAIAKTDCKLVTVSESRFQFRIENPPMFALEVMQSFSNRLRHLKHPQRV
jgi:CRP-like cAMP-binding protein